MKLVVGLGNPGEKYAGTRHNIGFMVAERFAGRNGMAIKKKGHQALYGVGRACGGQVTVLLPQTYMNRSGVSVNSACRTVGTAPEELIVIHDDLDLPYGSLKVKVGGGHGGHNGLRSICDQLGSREFIRIRVGVGRPRHEEGVTAHVLGPFSSEERSRLDNVVSHAAAAVETVLAEGPQRAMNRYNNLDIASEEFI